MAWCLTGLALSGKKPLPELILTKIHDDDDMVSLGLIWVNGYNDPHNIMYPETKL